MTAPLAAGAAEGAAGGAAGAETGSAVATRSAGTGSGASAARTPARSATVTRVRPLPRSGGGSKSAPSSRSKSTPRKSGEARSGSPTLVSGDGGALRGKGKSKSKRHGLGGHWRRVLVAELAVCLIVMALSPLTDKHRDEPASSTMRRMTAVAVLFLVLGLVSSGGRSAGKVAAAFGGLVTVGLVVSNRDLFTVAAKAFGAGNATGPAGPSGDGGTQGTSPGPGPGAGSGGVGVQPGTWVNV